MRVLALILVLPLAACASSWQRDALKIPSHQAQYVPPTTDRMAVHLAEMRARVTSWGVEILVLEPGQAQRMWGAAGQNPETGQRGIFLQADMAVDAQFEVLVHEAAHLLQPGGLSESEREVFAERVMVDVCQHYGHPARARSSTYLGRYKTGFGAQDAIAVDYRRAVRVLLGEERP